MATRIKYNNSIVRDYNQVQGVTHPSDLSFQVIRDYNVRYVTVENSAPRSIGIAITASGNMDEVPPLNFSLAPGEIRHLGINTIGEAMQFIHIIDLTTRKYVGEPFAMRTNANQFVLRDGLNKWFVSTYHRTTYRGK
jgi:hypothetical protein